MTTNARRAAARLGAELEAKLVQRLGVEWRNINYTQFKSSLRPPVIRLTDSEDPLARWNLELRSLELSRCLVLEFGWPEVLETLKRQVAQQFIDERLAVSEHRRGPTYRRLCWRLGVNPVPTSKVSAPKPGPQRDAAARIISRVHKLLALAGSPNRHEAETAAITAQRLILKFNIERARLDPRSAEHADDDDPRRRYGFRHLGPPLGRRGGRLAEHDQRLAKLLNEYFFVESAWLPVYLPRQGIRATVLEVCGLEVNLLMAEHVHAFLRATSRRLWASYQRAHEHSSERDRQAFLAGVMQGFEIKLAAQRLALQEQGLVWVPAPELGTYFRQRNPRLQYVQGQGGNHSEAYEHGSRAGQNITLSPPVASGPSRGGRPKALGP